VGSGSASRWGARSSARPGVPDGRAAVEPRREAAGPDARRDRGAAEPAGGHHPLRHPRPDRGDDDGGPGRGPQARRADAGRRAPDPLRPPRQPLRRRVHRLAVDEHRPGHLRREDGRCGSSSTGARTSCGCPTRPSSSTPRRPSCDGARSRSGCGPSTSPPPARSIRTRSGRAARSALVEMLGRRDAGPLRHRLAADRDRRHEGSDRRRGGVRGAQASRGRGRQSFTARFEPGAPPKMGSSSSTSASTPSTCTSSTSRPAPRCADPARAGGVTGAFGSTAPMTVGARCASS
jgi:hypothetical protein